MTSLSINQKKLIRSLARKKNRQETGLFLVEGDKMVREVLSGAASGGSAFEVAMLVATDDWLDEFGGISDGGTDTVCVKADELRQVSILQQPNRAMALVKQMHHNLDLSLLQNSLCIALENVQDPGNLGSIVRTGDWFGIRDIICSEDCVELYNPKVIQSTMGSFLRVRVHYVDLVGLIGEVRSADYQIFGTSGQGENLYETSLPSLGMVVLGNESRGLSEGVLRQTDRVLNIPHHDPDMHSESLNVATAAAVICAEFRRQGS